MRVERAASGLYIIDMQVMGPRKTRKIKGLIDTGSTDCACTYRIPTTLLIKPIDFRNIDLLGEVKRKCLVYDVAVTLGGRAQRVPIYRVQEIAEGADFLVGMSLLEKYNFKQEGDHLEITPK